MHRNKQYFGGFWKKHIGRWLLGFLAFWEVSNSERVWMNPAGLTWHHVLEFQSTLIWEGLSESEITHQWQTFLQISNYVISFLKPWSIFRCWRKSQTESHMLPLPHMDGLKERMNDFGVESHNLKNNTSKTKHQRNVIQTTCRVLFATASNILSCSKDISQAPSARSQMDAAFEQSNVRSCRSLENKALDFLQKCEVFSEMNNF